MKTKTLLSVLLLSMSITGFCTTWTIANSGATFTPDTTTITLGDSVNFALATVHDAREVSQATWNANGNTALSGGFQTSFGGGSVLPTQLTAGTHWYVCTPHASIGMKGVIIVQNPTGIAENHFPANISVYPNPSNGQFQFLIDGSQVTENCKIEIYNVQGEKIYQSVTTNTTPGVDLSNQPNGLYFVKFYTGQAVLTKKIVIE